MRNQAMSQLMNTANYRFVVPAILFSTMMAIAISFLAAFLAWELTPPQTSILMPSTPLTETQLIAIEEEDRAACGCGRSSNE